MLANVNALVVNESDEATHDVGNENDVEIENVVVTRCHHDHENETLLRSARRHVQANGNPLSRAMMQARCATHNFDPLFIENAFVFPDPRSITFAEWTLSDMLLPFFTR